MENNFKHTEGDWEIAPNKLTVFVNNIIVADCDTTDEYHSTKSEMEANAKLIAAAPDLLEALNELLCLKNHEDNAGQYIADSGGCSVDMPTSEEWKSKWDKALLAIKKATE